MDNQKGTIMKEKGNVAYTPELVESLNDGQVFVFGSNLIGYHSGGASLMAMQRFGAVWGQAEGPQGRCYAIPVDIRGEAVENVSAYLKRHIDKFFDYARKHQEQFFLVPRIGCGAAGFDDELMAPFFREALSMANVSLPKSFVEILKSDGKEKKDGFEQRVFNLIILDESGSMSSIEQQAVSGLNETFQTIRSAQRDHTEQKHFVSFVTFNSARIRKVMDRQAVNPSKKMKWTDYNPDECTPLFDAMGRSVNELRRYVSRNDVVLVTIITDGYENASREYSGKDIKRLVAELKGKGWVFAYIGTNQDVDAVADDMGIRSRKSYDYSAEGTECMFAEERSSRRRLFDRIAREGRQFMMDEAYDYFEANDEGEKEPEKKPDITWNMGDEENNDTPTQKEDQQAGPCDEPNAKDADEPTTLWGKIKHYLKG